jgi:hypothetical protein
MSHGKKSKRKKKKQPIGHEHSEGGAKLNNKAERINVSGKIEADFPPKLIEKYDTASNKENGWNQKQFFVSIITAILIFAYTTVAAWQGCSSQKAADAAKTAANVAKQQLELSTRPWVQVKGELNFEYLGFRAIQGVNGPYVRLESGMTYTLENTGNSPAFRVAESITPVFPADTQLPNEWKMLCRISDEMVTKHFEGVVIMPKGTTDPCFRPYSSGREAGHLYVDNRMYHLPRYFQPDAAPYQNAVHCPQRESRVLDNTSD